MRAAISLPTLLLASCLLAGCPQSKSLGPDTGSTPPAFDGGEPVDAELVDAPATDHCTPPSHLIVEVDGTGSQLRFGWTGAGHDFRMSNGVETALELFDCSVDCTRCRFTGPVKLPVPGLNHQRCVGAEHNTCEKDSDCGEAGKCRFFLGPALDASNTANIKLCALVHFEDLESPIPNGSRSDASAIQGSVDFSTGEANMNSMNVLMYTSIQFGGADCGVCEGDTTQGDGVLSGTCASRVGDGDPGPRFGEACDTQAVTAAGRAISYECPPDGLNYDGGVPTQIGPLATSTFEWTLSDQSPECGAAPGKPCWCGICDDPPGQPCHADTDCDGRCEAAATTQPNRCVQQGDGKFDPAPCTVTDAVRNTGECDIEFIYPLKIGAGCFGDEGVPGKKLRAIGVPGAFDDEGVSTAVIAGLACLPGSSNMTIGAGLGLPGPAMFELPIRTRMVGGESRGD